MSTVSNANAALILWRAAERDGRRTAVVEQGRTTDYARLLSRAGAVAGALLAAGIGPDDPVAILLERGADAAAVFFGALAAGAIAVVLGETLRPRQIEYVLCHSGARALLTTTDMLERHSRRPDTTARILNINAIPPRGDDRFRPAAVISSNSSKDSSGNRRADGTTRASD